MVNSVETPLPDPGGQRGGTARTVGSARCAQRSPGDVAARKGPWRWCRGDLPLRGRWWTCARRRRASVALPANCGRDRGGVPERLHRHRGELQPQHRLADEREPRHRAGAEVAVGVYPQAVVEGTDGRLFVLNGNLVNFSPAGPGSGDGDRRRGQAAGTIALTGSTPRRGVVRSGKLYVINSGNFGGNNSSLSVVNLSTLTEERVVPASASSPGAIAAGSDGNIYVGVYGSGIVVWNPGTLTFVRAI